MQAAEIRERLEGERATWRACVSPRSLWCLLSLPGSTALRLPAPKPRLFHAVLFLVTLLLAPLTAAQVISVPAGFYERPERVWVLPVVFTPADQTGAIPDPANPGFALDGTPVASATQRLWDAARANMIAQLRVTRAVYEDRLGDPSTGESRGTFGIASWNAATNAVEACSPSTLKPLPYVYVGSQSWAGYAGDGVSDSKQIIAEELLTAFGSSRYNCPFVFLTFLVHPTSFKPTPTAWHFNAGLNGGGGLALFPYAAAARAHVSAGDPGYNSLAEHLVSTLVHELGHAFGLWHVWHAYGGSTSTDRATIPVADLPYSKSCSTSFMSYNKANWTDNCFAIDADGFCAYPGPSVASAVPGDFLPEELRDLALNDLVFPDLTFDPDLEAPGQTLRVKPHDNGLVLPGHPALQVVSAPAAAYGSGAANVIGMHTRALARALEPFDEKRMWHSPAMSEGGTATITVTLPEAVTLAEVRVGTQYTGAAGTPTHRAAALEVQVAPVGSATFEEVAAAVAPPPNAKLAFAPVESDTWRLVLKAGPSGHVVVRGLRLFTAAGVELFAGREPTTPALARPASRRPLED